MRGKISLLILFAAAAISASAANIIIPVSGGGTFDKDLAGPDSVWTVHFLGTNSAGDSVNGSASCDGVPAAA